MTHLTQLFPSEHQAALEDIAAQIDGVRRMPLGFGSSEAMTFCQQLSDLLLNDTRAHTFPSLQALGFWLRPSSIRKLVADYGPSPDETVRVPRGVVFQIPPSNIETLFGYNCALSLLCGNVTLVRLPSQASPEQNTLLDFIAEIGATMTPAVAERLIFLRYAHDAAITAKLSALCNLRMVWGGDKTVSAIRQIPLPPLAHEISFANRFSMAVINADLFVTQDEMIFDEMARNLVNDVFQFGQMACASPRLLCWVGRADHKQHAAALFYPRLAARALEKFGAPETGENIAKLDAQFLALHDLDVAATTTFNPALTVVTLQHWHGVPDFKTLSFGHGLLLEIRLDTLTELADTAQDLDQTLAHWGFEESDLHALIKACNGRGFDRMVRFGEALAFDPVWDGTNLFDVLTKFVKVTL